MPRFDGTGPQGEGPFTGHADGYCAIRLPEPGSNQPAIGFAGLAGRPVRLRRGSPEAATPTLRRSRPPLSRMRGCGRGSKLGRGRHSDWRKPRA